MYSQLFERDPAAPSLKNATDTNAANTLTLILTWYNANLAWLTTPRKEQLSWLLMLTIGKDDDEDDDDDGGDDGEMKW